MKTSKEQAVGAEDEAVELGQIEVPATRRRGSPIVALRVNPDLLEAVSGYAAAHQLSVSDVFREGAERLLRGVPPGPTFVSGTLIVTAGGAIVQGSSSSGIGHSRREEIENPSIVVSSSG